MSPYLQSTAAKATVEDEQEVSSSQDEDRYVELESFKKLFKRYPNFMRFPFLHFMVFTYFRPKFYTKTCGKAFSALFSYALKLETRKNDLPLEFMNNDRETVWQFIAFRSKQISKEFRKRSVSFTTLR